MTGENLNRMNKRQVTCIRCPRGCAVTVMLGEDGSPVAVSGNACPRGNAYARAEVTNPVRTVTSTVPVDGSSLERRVSVKTATEVPKASVLDVARALANVRAEAPVSIGDVICHDVAGTGVDVVATKRA